MLTLLPSTAFLCAFVFFSSLLLLLLSCCMHGNNERERAKTSSQRTSYDDAFRQRAHYSFFFVMCSSVCQYTFLSHIYFFLCPLLIQRGRKQRNARPLSLALFYSYIYAQQKSSRVFFQENDKPDRKSLEQRTHGVKKGKKLGLIEQKEKEIFEESTTNKLCQ